MTIADEVPCRQCREPVETDRREWATPVCFACLPPPKRLPARHTDGCQRRWPVSLHCSCIKGEDDAAGEKGPVGT